MPRTYPEPLTIPPLFSHTQIFILLHGRGSSVAQFGPPLLEARITTTTSSSTSSKSEGKGKKTSTPTTTLRNAFPHARFVFLTTAPRRATVFNGSVINQWFDYWSPNLTRSDHELEEKRRGHEGDYRSQDCGRAVRSYMG